MSVKWVNIKSRAWGCSVAVGNAKICESCGDNDEEGTALRMARRPYHHAAGMYALFYHNISLTELQVTLFVAGASDLECYVWLS